MGSGAAGAMCQGYLFFTHDLASIEALRDYSPPLVTQFYADNGELIGEFSEEMRFLKPIEEIPLMLQNAFIAAEDKTFREHKGVDLKAIIRAVKHNLTSKDEHGASTITQQVARTFLLYRDKDYFRKIREAILARRIEEAFDKSYILYLYLNQIYLGSSAYGVEAAAQIYFGKTVKELTLGECAILAGLPKAPSRFSPKNNMKKCLERRKYVLNRMLEDGYITKAQYQEAQADKPKLFTRINPYLTAAPDFTEHVRRHIASKYGEDTLYKGGLKVYTTVDLALTAKAREAINRGLTEVDRRQGYRGPIKTQNAQGVMDFLAEKTMAMKEPLKFSDITEGVITDIDQNSIYVRMGSYTKDGARKDYVGKVRIDPDPNWWVRKPYVRADMRTRNFVQGDLPFQVGDVILVRIKDPNKKRRELYLQKYGDADPQMRNYKEYTEDMVEYFPLEIEQSPVAQAALMLRENRSGYVKAILGGSSADAKLNRATQSRRQPGSSFKPVIYAAALNKGFTCADRILDTPIALTVPGTGEVWRPKNYGGGFHGPVSFREALVKSKNIPTIKILQQIGVEQAKAYARKLGYTSHLANNLTLALGSTGVSLEEQLNAYSVFPNQGYLAPSVYIRKIVDRNGKVLERNDPPALLDASGLSEQNTGHRTGAESLKSDRARMDGAPNMVRRSIDEGTAFIMTSLLKDVVQHGTAQNLKRIVGRSDIAGKTGTTNASIDAWFMGFSPDYTCGVWVGFDDQHTLGHGETGGRAAAPIWGYFMREVLKGRPVKEFPSSDQVELRPIDPETGLVTASAQGVMEVFKQGSGPAEIAPQLVKGSPWNYSGSDLDQF